MQLLQLSLSRSVLVIPVVGSAAKKSPLEESEKLLRTYGRRRFQEVVRSEDGEPGWDAKIFLEAVDDQLIFGLLWIRSLSLILILTTVDVLLVRRFAIIRRLRPKVCRPTKMNSVMMVIDSKCGFYCIDFVVCVVALVVLLFSDFTYCCVVYVDC